MARGRKVTKSQKILIAKLFVDGMKYDDIAEEVGLSRISIIRCVNHDAETKELIESLETKYQNEIFSQCLTDIKQGFVFNSRNVEMMIEGYNK